MRNFGSIHYGSSGALVGAAYIRRNERYYKGFLPKFSKKLKDNGYNNMAERVVNYMNMLAMGFNEDRARATSASDKFIVPSSDSFRKQYAKFKDMAKTVSHFYIKKTGSNTAVSDTGVESSPSIQEIVEAAGYSPSSGTIRDRFLARRGERQSERQDRVASGETFEGRGDAQEVALASEEESFFSRYRVPIVIGSALALSGGAYYFFVMRK